jgi:hypothetical protein
VLAYKVQYEVCWFGVIWFHIWSLLRPLGL